MADFYSGFNDAGERGQRSTLAQLQALSGAQNLIGGMAEQEAKEKARRRGEELRTTIANLGPNATSEQVMQAARPFLEPDKLATLAQGDVTNRRTQENQREMARGRLAQAAQTANLIHEDRMRNATTAEARAAEQARHNFQIEAIQRDAVANTGARLTWETGAPAATGAALAAGRPMPSAPVQSGNAVLDPEVMQNPDMAAAVAKINAVGRAPQHIEIPSASNAAPQAQTPVVGTVPPVAALPAPAVAAAPDNLDARDLRARGQAAFDAAKQAPAAASPSAPSTPAAPANGAPPAAPMPQFVGSPKDQAAARNKWMLEQQKLNQKMNINLAGGRESAQNNRVLSGGNQVAAALKNIVELPISGASTGIFGERGHPKGLFEAGKETLANQMTTQEVNDYKIMATGIERSLAAIEAAGLATTGSLTNQMAGVVWREGWTNFSKLRALAETKQIVEKGLEVQLANPRVPEETKALVRKVIKDVNDAVPFSNADLTRLQKEQGVDPKITLADVVKKKEQGAAGGWSIRPK